MIVENKKARWMSAIIGIIIIPLGCWLAGSNMEFVFKRSPHCCLFWFSEVWIFIAGITCPFFDTYD